MTTPPALTPADPEDVAFTLSFALRHNGRRRYANADEAMANLTAKHLMAALERSGYVVLHKPSPPPGPAPNTRAPGRDD